MTELEQAIKKQREQFLAGHMSDELERHCRNVGRIAVEFATLEALLGNLRTKFENQPADSRDYMRHVSTFAAVKATLKHLRSLPDGTLNLDVAQLETAYWRFKGARDRFAHAAVGSVLERSGDGVLHIRTDQLKHAKGESIVELPSDAEADTLVCEMRRFQDDLQSESLRMSVVRLNERISASTEGILKRVAQMPGEAIRRSFSNLPRM